MSPLLTAAMFGLSIPYASMRSDDRRAPFTIRGSLCLAFLNAVGSNADGQKAQMHKAKG